MKILYIIPQINVAGGLGRVLSVKANTLAEKGYEVAVLTYHNNGNDSFYHFDPKINFIHLNHRRDKKKSGIWNRVLRFRNNRKYKSVLRQKIEGILYQNRYDIVISIFNGPEIHFLPDIKDGSKKIGEMHFSYYSLRESLSQYSGLKKIVLKRTFHKIEKAYTKFDALVVLTKEDQKKWSAINNYNLFQIYNPISFNPVSQPDYSVEKVLAVGNLVKNKGFDLLIDTWNILRSEGMEWILDIYGQGKEKEALQNKIEANNLENLISLKGTVSNMDAVMQEYSIFTLSSRSEGLSLVIMEAMASGLPVVSFDCQYGPRELVADKVSGYLAEPANTKDLAKKLKKLMKSEEKRYKFGRKGKSLSQTYSPKNIIKQWEDLFNQLIEK